MKKVKALKNGFISKRGILVVEGREYDVLDSNNASYKIKNNLGENLFYPKSIFEEVKEVKKSSKRSLVSDGFEKESDVKDDTLEMEEK